MRMVVLPDIVGKYCLGSAHWELECLVIQCSFWMRLVVHIHMHNHSYSLTELQNVCASLEYRARTLSLSLSQLRIYFYICVSNENIVVICSTATLLLNGNYLMVFPASSCALLVL